MPFHSSESSICGGFKESGKDLLALLLHQLIQRPVNPIRLILFAADPRLCLALLALDKLMLHRSFSPRLTLMPGMAGPAQTEHRHRDMSRTCGRCAAVADLMEVDIQRQHPEFALATCQPFTSAKQQIIDPTGEYMMAFLWFQELGFLLIAVAASSRESGTFVSDVLVWADVVDLLLRTKSAAIKGLFIAQTKVSEEDVLVSGCEMLFDSRFAGFSGVS
jgi:hypothetical protein